MCPPFSCHCHSSGSNPVGGCAAVLPNLPLRLAEYIDMCILRFWTLLNKDKMFPDKSAFSTIVRKSLGKGYEALRLMSMQTSPYLLSPRVIMSTAHQISPLENRLRSTTSYFAIIWQYLL
jgi:hypothetical protein